MQACGDALTWFAASEDGTRVLAVTRSREEAGESVHLDGGVVLQLDEVTGLGFVGEGAAARPWIRGRREGRGCLWTEFPGEGLCCDAPVGWTGAPAAPVLLCDGPVGPYTISSDGEALRVDALPPEFIVTGADGRIVWYITRLGATWRLHGADGRVEPLPGSPALLLPGPEPGDRPRVLLGTADGQGWYTGRDGDRYTATSASMLHEIPGLGAVYAAHRGGRVCWVGPGFATPEVDALGSAPHRSSVGLSWWELHGERWVWVTVPYDVDARTMGGNR